MKRRNFFAAFAGALAATTAVAQNVLFAPRLSADPKALPGGDVSLWRSTAQGNDDLVGAELTADTGIKFHYPNQTIDFAEGIPPSALPVAGQTPDAFVLIKIDGVPYYLPCFRP